jgi:transposase
MSTTTILRIWAEAGLQPHRTETFKFSTDPALEVKVRDVVGLYLDPPERAIVLSLDEKTQIQALDRTQPMLPLRPGQVERHTHAYKRNGTTCLFAALEVRTGKVTQQTRARHRGEDFLAFLRQVKRAYPEGELHVVLDNVSNHKTPAVAAWLASNPRITFHFTPTSAPWMNHIETWFGILTRQAIRRGSFRSVKELIAMIDAFHPPVERRLQPVHVGQDRRRDPRQGRPQAASDQRIRTLGTILEPGDSFADGHLGARLVHDLCQRTAGCGLHLDHRLVRLNLGDDIPTGDTVADALEPATDLPGLHVVAELGHLDRDAGHPCLQSTLDAACRPRLRHGWVEAFPAGDDTGTGGLAHSSAPMKRPGDSGPFIIACRHDWVGQHSAAMFRTRLTLRKRPSARSYRSGRQASRCDGREGGGVLASPVVSGSIRLGSFSDL